MNRISFSWTTQALLAGQKTVTRRAWKDSWAKHFRAGDFVAAYDKAPFAGGKQIATIRLSSSAYQERVGDAPESDYHCEGLAWMANQGIRIQGQLPGQFWDDWRMENPLVWVVRFELAKEAR